MTSDSIPLTRKCSWECQRELPLTSEYFSQQTDCKYGFMHICRTCATEKMRRWRADNPGRAKELNHRVYTNNKEHHLAKSRQWAKKNPEKSAAIKQRWVNNNPERKRETGRNYARRNPTKGLEWRKLNPSSYRISNKTGKAKRRALMNEAEGDYTKEDLLAIYADQEGRCAYCGITLYWDIPGDIHLDHVIALTQGGSNWPDNLALTCASCNCSKQDKSYEEWIAVRGW